MYSIIVSSWKSSSKFLLKSGRTWLINFGPKGRIRYSHALFVFSVSDFTPSPISSNTILPLTPRPSGPDHSQRVEERCHGYDHLQPARATQTCHPLGRYGLETPGVHQDQVTNSVRVKGMEARERDEDLERQAHSMAVFPCFFAPVSLSERGVASVPVRLNWEGVASLLQHNSHITSYCTVHQCYFMSKISCDRGELISG